MNMELKEPIAAGYTAEVFDWKPGWIIKLFRDFAPAEWVDYEARVSRAAAETGIPAPRVGDIVEVQGRRGIVYEKIDGQSMLKGLISQPRSLKKNAPLLAELHHRVHSTTPNGDIPRQRDVFRFKIGQTDLEEEVKERLLGYLESLPDGNHLCHNDFHPDNILVAPQGSVIIDWMDGSVGNPEADVARTLLMLRIGKAHGAGFIMRSAISRFRKRLHKLYLKRYLAISSCTLDNLKRWEPVVAAVRLLENHPGEDQELKRMIGSI